MIQISLIIFLSLKFYWIDILELLLFYMQIVSYTSYSILYFNIQDFLLQPHSIIDWID